MTGNSGFDDAPSEPPIDRPACPGQINTAYRLWLTSIVLLLICCVFALPPEQDLDQLLATSTLGQQVFIFDPEFALGTVGSVRSLIQVGALVAAAIWVMVVRKMRTGSDWARRVLAALGVLHILAMLTQLIRDLPAGTPAMVLIILLVLSITEFTAISTMFHPAAATYFRSAEQS